MLPISFATNCSIWKFRREQRRRGPEEVLELGVGLLLRPLRRLLLVSTSGRGGNERASEKGGNERRRAAMLPSLALREDAKGDR